MLQAGRGGEGHRDRAAVSGLDLALHVEARRAGDMGALARVGPGRGMEALLDRRPHQLVIGGVEADKIDPAPVAVVGVEFGRVPVGERAPLEAFGRAEAGPEGAEAVGRPFGALAANRILQPGVGFVEIVIGQFDRLVDHLVGDGAVGVERGASGVVSVGRAVGHVSVPHYGIKPNFSLPQRKVRRRPCTNAASPHPCPSRSTAA